MSELKRGPDFPVVAANRNRPFQSSDLIGSGLVRLRTGNTGQTLSQIIVFAIGGYFVSRRRHSRVRASTVPATRPRTE